MIKIIRTEHTMINCTSDEEYGMTIGNIVLGDDGIDYAEVIDCVMCTMDDVTEMRLFLDEVEKEFMK